MRALIISGGSIEDSFALEWLQQNSYDLLIAADSGMNFLHRNWLMPDVIAGDFDSVDEVAYSYFIGEKPETNENVGKNVQEVKKPQILRLNPVKDDTDTEFVIREAIRRGATEITILGATGTRLDHVLANVQLLGIGLEKDISIELVDAYNRIRVIDSVLEIAKKQQFGSFVSILPIKGDAKGVTLEGMKYSLQDAEVLCFSSLGISNEIVEEVAKISVKEGILLVIESRD